MARRLRLLLLLPFPPQLNAPHGGGRVIAHFISNMIDRHEVAMLYMRVPEEQSTDDFFLERCEMVEEIVRPSTGKTFSRRLLHYWQRSVSIAKLRPMWVADWTDRSFLERAGKIIRDFRPDIVQAEYHVMGQYLSAYDAWDAPSVLVEHEPGVRAAPYIRNLPSSLTRFFDKLEQLSWRRYESALFGSVDAIVVFTEDDKLAIRDLAGTTPIYRIPPGIPIPRKPLNPLGYPTASILFIGNFIHAPNADAALRLGRNIFPSVQAHFPDLKLYIVGDQPPREVKRMQRDNIIVTGRVPHITPYLDRAALFVAPMSSGGGIRIKIMDAMAAGKAVVASPLAVAGLGLTDRDQVSIAATDSDFAEKIIQLLHNPAERLSLAKNARAWASEHFEWKKSISSYEWLYVNLLDKGHQPERHPEFLVKA